MTPENVAMRERVQKQARDGLAEQFIAEVNDGRWDAISYDLAPGPSAEALASLSERYCRALADPLSPPKKTAWFGQSLRVPLFQSLRSRPARSLSTPLQINCASAHYRSMRPAPSSRRSVTSVS